ncbi:hypothetical protein BpHYR1_034413 [Brachionus plicatilis]|uniref:Uncharacterized protein n=1 Tax=Brachionus plicatilis TaxID=10195 RepID=A0A3M7P5M4_BRAPC|nr:hypothetical protein BpHYR1_034413 [Brachionus plicatilis]
MDNIDSNSAKFEAKRLVKIQFFDENILYKKEFEIYEKYRIEALYCSAFCRDFAHHWQTFTVDAALNVAPFCIHRINFKLLEKKSLY